MFFENSYRVNKTRRTYSLVYLKHRQYVLPFLMHISRLPECIKNNDFFVANTYLSLNKIHESAQKAAQMLF